MLRAPFGVLLAEKQLKEEGFPHHRHPLERVVTWK
jgi:hypothetical protein